MKVGFGWDRPLDDDDHLPSWWGVFKKMGQFAQTAPVPAFMNFREFAGNHGTSVWIGGAGQITQCRAQTYGGFEQNAGAFLGFEGLEKCVSLFAFPREKAFKKKTVGGKTTPGEGGYDRGRSRQYLHGQRFGDDLTDQRPPWIADPRTARIADKGKVGSRFELVAYPGDLCSTVVFVKTYPAGPYFVAMAKDSRQSGVFRQDAIYRLQYPNGPE